MRKGTFMWKRVFQFILIGLISGLILAVFLKFLEIWTGSLAYRLLFEVNYVPVFNRIYPRYVAEIIFHFSTCIFSIVILYNILKLKNWEKSVTAYLIPIGIGSSALFLLTLWAHHTPEITDYKSWVFWIIGHVLFALSAVTMIKKWIK